MEGAARHSVKFRRVGPAKMIEVMVDFPASSLRDVLDDRGEEERSAVLRCVLNHYAYLQEIVTRGTPMEVVWYSRPDVFSIQCGVRWRRANLPDRPAVQEDRFAQIPRPAVRNWDEETNRASQGTSESVIDAARQDRAKRLREKRAKRFRDDLEKATEQMLQEKEQEVKESKQVEKSSGLRASRQNIISDSDIES